MFFFFFFFFLTIWSLLKTVSRTKQVFCSYATLLWDVWGIHIVIGRRYQGSENWTVEVLWCLSDALFSTTGAKQVFILVLWIQGGAWSLGCPVWKDHPFMKINVSTILLKMPEACRVSPLSILHVFSAVSCCCSLLLSVVDSHILSGLLSINFVGPYCLTEIQRQQTLILSFVFQWF